MQQSQSQVNSDSIKLSTGVNLKNSLKAFKAA